MHILIVAAENSALANAKVGGLGDVVGEIGPELAKRGCTVTTVIPAYGFVHRQNTMARFASVDFPFRGKMQEASLYEAAPKRRWQRVRHMVLDHPLLGAPAAVYAHDPPERPFATDASRFALFCSAAAAAVVQGRIQRPDVIHLHDWHTAFMLILRQYHGAFQMLKHLRTVYTVHNLALQGVRPFLGDESALFAWFPDLEGDVLAVSDPRWPHCVNPMAAGIRLADAVHTVSPAYAEEILRPCRPGEKHPCGEGLEPDLRAAQARHRLFGILNGCPYPVRPQASTVDFKGLCILLQSAVLTWLAGTGAPPTAHFLAHARLDQWIRRDAAPGILLTSVSRLTDQKMRLMKDPGASGASGLAALLKLAEEVDGRYILLGTGDPEYERFFTDMAARFERFVFLNGYAEAGAGALYAAGDLFLMPSVFEPCGISQLLAMREGQPCVVNRVGGLKDTVRHEHTGFAFSGNSPADQVDSFIAAVRQAVHMHRDDPARYQAICRQAAQERFSWGNTAKEYIEKLYRG